MGLGDELMAAGEAARRRLQDPRKVKIIDKNGRNRWHPLWAGNPSIAAPGEPGACQVLTNGGGCRAYIDYSQTTRNRWGWREHPPFPAELPLARADARGAGKVIVEPHVKASSPNKQWGWDNWQALVNARPGVPWLQIGPAGVRRLDGVSHLQTQRIEDAFNLLLAAQTAVLPEGCLHHAAAAFGKRVVVLFGGYITPAQTGYSTQRSLFIDDRNAQGWRVPHPACAEAWKKITVPEVVTELEVCLG